MKNIFLVKDGNEIRHYYDEAELKAAGFKKADKTVSEEEFASNGCYARLLNGEIIVGKTTAEKEAEAKQEEISGLMSELEHIDRVAGAGRHVRDVSVSAGVVLDAVRILLTRFARDLDIKIPADFAKGFTTAEELLRLSPGEGLTPEETEDFYVFKALLLLTHYDPAINPGLAEIKKAEEEAKGVREKLQPLLAKEETA